MKNLRREARWLPIIALIVLLALASAFYLLSNQRVTNPLDDSYTLNAEFQNAIAVVPNLGAAVNVAGVKVGQISGRELKNGRAVLELRIEPDKLAHIYDGATARLVPNTPLKDMQVDLTPGDPKAAELKHGDTISVANTATPVDSDELMHALDTDTREYLSLLIANTNIGLHGRGPDLRALLRTLGPASGQIRRIAALMASRRHTLPRLVHNLNLLTTAAAQEDDSIARIVTAGNATLSAVASQDAALRESITRLPGTLSTARSTLLDAAPFARSLRRTLEALEPSIPRLKETLQSTPDALRGFLPLPVPELKRFTTAVLPLGPPTKSAAQNLGAANPSLIKAFAAINDTTNILGYNPEGGPHGYLFWLAWFAHNANSMLSTQDAHGSVWRGLALVSCASIAGSGQIGVILETVLGTAATCP
jgi:phospholipid/cholesterol/gamma-HCH transport system substrate-binding protein